MDLLHHPHSPVSLDTVTIPSCVCLPFCHQSSCDPPSRGLHKTSEGALWHLTLAWVFRLFCEMLDWIEIWGTGSLSLHLEPVVFLRLFLQSGRVCYPAGRSHCLLCLFFSYSGWYISNQHPDEWQEPRFYRKNVAQSITRPSTISSSGDVRTHAHTRPFPSDAHMLHFGCFQLWTRVSMGH